MIKVVVLVCRLMVPGPCTEDTAVAVVLADTNQNDGTPCIALGRALLKELNTNLKPTDTVKVACVKDGKPFY